MSTYADKKLLLSYLIHVADFQGTKRIEASEYTTYLDILCIVSLYVACNSVAYK